MQRSQHTVPSRRTAIAERVRDVLDGPVSEAAVADPDGAEEPLAVSDGWLPPAPVDLFGAAAAGAAPVAERLTRRDRSSRPVAVTGRRSRAGRPDSQPERRHRRLRWEPDRRAVLAIAGVVVIVALATAWWVLSARPRSIALGGGAPSGVPAVIVSPGDSGAASAAPAIPPASGAPASGDQASIGATAGTARLTVDVSGKVRRPGVYRLAPGARVADALRAAGGVRSGVSTTRINLAQPLSDGEQVLVGVPGTAAVLGGAADPGGADAGTGSAGGPVDLNSATLEQLQTLPGIGPVLAQHILDWRTQHGRFGSVDDLNQVSGIGTVKFASLRPLVTV